MDECSNYGFLVFVFDTSVFVGILDRVVFIIS